MAYEPKEGQGSAFPNRNGSRGSPDYKGSLLLPDGSVIGLAIWKKSGQKGEFLSISMDDREGAYQAKQLGRKLTRIEADDQRDDRREQPRERESRYEDRGRDRRDDRGSRHSDRSGSRHSQARDDRGRGGDLDDEIPF